MNYNRPKFNRNSNDNYYYQNQRYQAANYWKSNMQYTPRWHWVQEPHDGQGPAYYKSREANRQRQHSDEPAPKRRAASDTALGHTTAESAPPSDSLTNKLTERTSMIIDSVLSGKDSADAKNRAKTATVQTDKSTGHMVNTSHVNISSQSKRPELLPTDKPKDVFKFRFSGHPSKVPDASRQKGSASSTHVSRENVTAASKVQSNAPSKSDILLSPNSSAGRTGLDIQASLVRMATAPRSRREQLELERMLHEHTKKSAASKERLHDMQPALAGAGAGAGTSVAQNTPQLCPTDSGRSDQTSSSSANNAVVIDDDTRNGKGADVVESRPCSSSAVQSKSGSTTGPQKAAKTPRRTKKKSQTAGAPQAQNVAKTVKAKAKATKGQASNKGVKAAKKNKKVQNLNKRLQKFNNTYAGRQRRGNSLPFTLACNLGTARPVPSEMQSSLNLGSPSGLGSLGLSPHLVQGLVGSQHMSPTSANRATTSLSTTQLLSKATERGPLDTLLQMSLHEEHLCNKLSQCSSEIEQLQSAIAKLDEEVKKRIQLKAALLEEQTQLRQRRLQLLQESVVPSPSNQAGGVNIPARETGSEAGTLPSMYGVEAGIGDGADNASYCRGVQPITIEPMDCDSDSNDIEPLLPTDAASSSTPAAALRQNTSGVTRPGGNSVTQPAMRVVYCGTVSSDQLMQQNALGQLAQSLVDTSNGSAPASNVRTSESRGRNLSDFARGGTTGPPVSADSMPSDVGGLLTADRTRGSANTQQLSANISTPSNAKQQLPSAASSSDSALSTSRKSTSGSKPRRAQSLESESSAACESSATRRRSVAASSSSASSSTLSLTHSLPASAAVRCISVLQNAVICACNDGQVHRVPLSTFVGGSVEDSDDGFTWDEGPVMCMLATRAGPGRLITLFSVTADKRLVISSYPSPAVKKVFPGVRCHSYNCIAETGRTVYVGLCDGRVACITTTSMKRKTNDIACGRGDGSHVCALAVARVCAQSLICIAVCDSEEIFVRDVQTAKPYGTPLSGLTAPARYLQGLCHYCISSSGGSEVHVHSLQTCLMERRFTFTSGVVGLAVRVKEKQVVVADGNGTVSCIAVKDGVRYAMYTRQMITAIGAANDTVFIGTADGKVERIPADSPSYWKCRYLHCLCCFWRAEDLLKHLLDDHVDHLLMSAGSADTVTCKWEACLELLAANTKALHRHFTEHAANEQSIMTKS